MPLVIIIFLISFSTSGFSQDFSCKIQSSGAVSWITTNNLGFSQQFKPGVLSVQGDGSYYFDDNYYISLGAGYSQLDGSLKQTTDSFAIDDHLFRNVNDAQVSYRGHFLNIPVELGFENKKDRSTILYPFAGVGLINHILLNADVQYYENNTETKYLLSPRIYSLSYCFFVGLKWNFVDQNIFFARFKYQEGILPIAEDPQARLKQAGISVGFEYKIK